MEVNSLFNRTVMLCREKMSDGQNKIRRIPWDLIDYKDSFFISPMPVGGILEGGNGTSIDPQTVADMFFDEADMPIIDEVVKLEFCDSLADFQNKFENVNAFYVSDGSEGAVSGEMGYPRT